ncbi:50S ribosomal protein L13 [bacterium]|nr:MAG: 50S ribosomal protein L13 [bacterium]
MSSRTFVLRQEDAHHDWFIVDAEGQRLGLLAARVARVLTGKHKATYTPHTDAGDHVVVINAEKIELSGAKWTQKVYRSHSGYPGGLHEETAQQVRQEHPERLIERAVRGMLAPNKLRGARMNRLKVYVGGSHPHSGQNPQPLAER